MPRTPTYDRDHVLNSAMLLFWKYGYRNTSVKDLTRVTGLQPGSLYGAFHDKRSLFILSLEMYFTKLKLIYRNNLEQPGSVLRNIRQLCEILMRLYQASDVKGCMLQNSLLEMENSDPGIYSRIQEMYHWIELALESVLEVARKNGEIKQGASTAELAKQLIILMMGLQTYSQLEIDETAIDIIISHMIQNID